MTQEIPDSREITHWLKDWKAGDAAASERLFAAVYPELRRIAGRFLRNERMDHTLEPSALVNELYLRVFGSGPIDFKDRAHFYAIAAETMRRILIDHARARVAGKRGGEQRKMSLSVVDGWNPVARNEDLLMLDQFNETGKSSSACCKSRGVAILRRSSGGGGRRGPQRVGDHG